MKIVDTRGEDCPRPIIKTRKALTEISEGESFILLTDSVISFRNISSYLNDNGISFSVSEKNGVWELQLKGRGGFSEKMNAEQYCSPSDDISSEHSFIVAISSDEMGKGDPGLGRKLMKSFFVALSCSEKLPSAVVFYNSGVKLAVKGSESADIISELGSKGCEIILCGTCTEHFGINGKLAAGKIEDMLQILNRLSAAQKVIRP